MDSSWKLYDLWSSICSVLLFYLIYLLLWLCYDGGYGGVRRGGGGRYIGGGGYGVYCSSLLVFWILWLFMFWWCSWCWDLVSYVHNNQLKEKWDIGSKKSVKEENLGMEIVWHVDERETGKEDFSRMIELSENVNLEFLLLLSFLKMQHLNHIKFETLNFTNGIKPCLTLNTLKCNT